jgi:glycosyltransferase involved in cell wall biosynthesis
MTGWAREMSTRVLFVSPIFPRDFSASVYGVFQRMRMWLDAIQLLGAELDILFLPPSGESGGPGSAGALARELAEHWGIRSNVVLCEREPDTSSRGFLATYVTPYFLPALRIRPVPHIGSYAGKRQKDAFAQCLARCPDIVLFQRLSATAPWGSSSLGGARGFIDLDDVEHVRFIREITQPPHWRSKPLMYLQVPPLWWDERAAIVRSDTAFVCSEHDRQYLRRTMRVRNVEVMPNAVARVDDGPLTTEPNVLFIGNYRYGPNVVAAEHLIGDVWPRVARISPRARLLIAGLHSEDLPSFRNPPRGVEFLGFMTDLTALYRRTRVMCCPIQSGAGTRVKILEAASHGVPVVSTPLGAEGLDFVGDSDIVLRDDAAGLAEACGALLLDDEQAGRIGAAARQRVRAQYDREAVVSRMSAALAGGGR